MDQQPMIRPYWDRPWQLSMAQIATPLMANQGKEASVRPQAASSQPSSPVIRSQHVQAMAAVDVLVVGHRYLLHYENGQRRGGCDDGSRSPPKRPGPTESAPDRGCRGGGGRDRCPAGG